MCSTHLPNNSNDSINESDGLLAPPTPSELLEAFEGLLDWENRYAYLIDLGAELAPMHESLKVDANKVFGCQSNVWIIPQWVDTNGRASFDFAADSDSQIVKGLVAIVRALYFSKTPSEILKINEETFLEQLGLRKHLTPGRSNGLTQMIKRIKSVAEKRVTEEENGEPSRRG